MEKPSQLGVLELAAIATLTPFTAVATISSLTTVAAVSPSGPAIATESPAPTATRRPLFARTRHIDRQDPALELFLVEHFHCLLSFLGGAELDKRKPAGTPGEFVQYDVDGTDHAGCRKIILQIVIHRLIREIANKQSRFVHNPSQTPKNRWEILPWQECCLPII